MKKRILWAQIFFVALSCMSGLEVCQSSDWTDQSSVRGKRLLDNKENDSGQVKKRRKCWDFLSSELYQAKMSIVRESNPSSKDLEACVKTVIATSSSQGKSINEAMLASLGTPLADFNKTIDEAKKNCPALGSPSSFSKQTQIVSPYARPLGMSRQYLSRLRKMGGIDSALDLEKNRQQVHEDIEEYDRLVQSQKAVQEQDSKNAERNVGLTRAGARHLNQCLREGFTEKAFEDYSQWLKAQKRTRSEINQYFIENMAYLFKEIVIKGVRFFYNPQDIDDENAQRMLLGLNPKGFEWHHISQDQRNGSIIVCIPQEIHDPVLHPFNSEGSQIDRLWFGRLKILVNQALAQILLYSSQTEHGE